MQEGMGEHGKELEVTLPEERYALSFGATAYWE